MIDPETKQILCSILAMMREQAIYLHRQHGWIIAVAEAVEKHPDLAAHLKQHPFYDQGPRLDIDKTQRLLEKVDALIRQLKLQA
jgi:hypothetical protein